MKQLAQYQDGRLEIQEVPEPQAPPGGILVRTTCSVISPGTEKMKVEQARMSLLQKARARPDQVRKVLDTARTLGWKSALEKVRNRLESPSPLGYSAAGVVVAVDPLNTRFRVGDRVACGGAECAHHAEMIAVPDLLAARVPEGVTDGAAAYTTLAAIALQAVRQAEVRLGERVLVVGQGLVGLLVTRLLVLSGARVMAVDLSEARLETAVKMGAERVGNANHGGVREQAQAWSGGLGVDAVMVCVGGRDRGTTELAVEALRERGVLVIVGMHDVELEWKQAYMKDIQVRYSRSYGPGRYDASYEWGGVDYPAAHVRWTENRNFEACLELMRTGQLDLEPLTTRRVPFAEAVGVYASLMEAGNGDIGVVLEYEGRAGLESQPVTLAGGRAGGTAGTVSVPVERLHVLGAGNFARSMLLPHVKGKVRLGTVVNATGLSARHVREKFGFEAAATDAEEVLSQRGEAVLIATRHHLHAPYVLRGLEAGQQVFVEKPLCLTEVELEAIERALAMSEGSLMVGFNRRLAPATVEALRRLERVAGPKTISYTVNAGPLPRDHWYANREESGGRVLGEACHFLDFFCHMTGSAPVSVSAQTDGEGDSLAAQVAFADGSVAQLHYTTGGSAVYPKEVWRVFAGEVVVECEEFQRLSVFQGRRKESRRFGSKGHAEEMAAWLGFLRGESRHPLLAAEAVRSMRLTFAALRAARENQIVRLGQA